MSVDMETCHIVVMNDDEMDMLKLLASAMRAQVEGRELPPNPTQEQVEIMLALFQRILEM